MNHIQGKRPCRDLCAIPAGANTRRKRTSPPIRCHQYHPIREEEGGLVPQVVRPIDVLVRHMSHRLRHRGGGVLLFFVRRDFLGMISRHTTRTLPLQRTHHARRRTTHGIRVQAVQSDG